MRVCLSLFHKIKKLMKIIEAIKPGPNRINQMGLLIEEEELLPK